jgi:hypothetical protein
MSQTSKDIGDILEGIASKDSQENFSVYSMMDEWFNPRPALIKHVIVIQFIACFIVGLFMVATLGENLDPNTLVIVLFTFTVLVFGLFGAYQKL